MMQSITLESASAIRKLLGGNLTRIKQLDPLRKERPRTAAIRKRLLRARGPSCGYCATGGKVDAAHIVPLELGAVTEESNIILLCHPCHLLYDSGHLSITAMEKVADDWRRGTVRQIALRPMDSLSAPAPTITMPPNSARKTFDAVLVLQRKKKYLRASKLIKARLEEPRLSHAAHVYLTIKLGELTRRRSAKGLLPLALQILSNLDAKSIPERYLPVYYYELAYVHRLLGEHDTAASIIRLSIDRLWKSSKARKADVGYVAIATNEILCRLAAKEGLTANEAARYERQLRELEAVARSQGKYWGGRWAINCAAHTLQVRLTREDAEGSWQALERFRKLFYDEDITTGWDAAGRQTLSSLDGVVRVLFPRTEHDLRTGIGLLSRSFVSRLGGTQRPEGIRDAGMGLSRGLRKLGGKDVKIAAAIEDLMRVTVDGTSVLWPYRASS